MKNEGLEKMKMKVKPNKKISNNEPLERRTEFLWNQKQILPRNQMKMTLGSKDRESQNLYERKTTTPKKKTQKKKTNEKMKEM